MERVQLRSIMTDMFFFFIEFYLILARIRKQIKKNLLSPEFFSSPEKSTAFFSLLQNDMERKFGQVRI